MATLASAQTAPVSDSSTNQVAEATSSPTVSEAQEQAWNWHVQNTDIVQGHPGFSAKYSGPLSMKSTAELQNTESVDLYLGARLWQGAQVHVDGLMWQGFGLSHTVGADGFPNGESFKVGTQVPNFTFARVFLQQAFGFGGEQETVEDDQLQLAGKRDISRLTLTVGKFSAKDVFDNNAYANDARTQFMNWSLMANGAWDYPADALGYINGFTAELNQKDWTVRYGFFQVPRVVNGISLDMALTRAWSMVSEYERRFSLGEHPGAVRVLGYLTQAHMGSFETALNTSGIGVANIDQTREYRRKYGFGLNVEQEVCQNVGVFARLGWSDGHSESWAFTDVDRTVSLGASVKGAFWNRPKDTWGLALVGNGLSGAHRDFFAAGGTGILAGDGALNYGWERILETYYDIQVCAHLNAALDYQFIANPAYNRDRGPISVLGARVHWEY